MPATRRKTASYLRAVNQVLGIEIQAVAIDAPSAPRAPGVGGEGRGTSLSCTRYQLHRNAECRRLCCDSRSGSSSLGGRRPAIDTSVCEPDLDVVWIRAVSCLSAAGWPCLEVYPQATVRALGAGNIHKSGDGAVLTQSAAAAKYTNWPRSGRVRAQVHGWGTLHAIGSTRISPRGLPRCPVSVEKGSARSPMT